MYSQFMMQVQKNTKLGFSSL